MMKKLLFIPILLLTIFSTNAQELEKEIDSLMKKYNTIGLAIAVVKKNKVIYNQSFGLKEIEHKTKLENDNIFRIASISKSFAATSIMQLVDQNKIALDDDLSDLIGFKVRNPSFPNEIITLRMALSHTSSLNDREGYFSLDAINPSVNKNWSNCYIAKKPGTNYLYCNLNFNIIGAIIEKVSGERYDNYVRHHILNPLGLYGGLNIDSLDSKKFVTLYEYDKKNNSFNPSPSAYTARTDEIKNYKLGYSTPIFSPTGGIKISALNLAKYMMMHINYGKSNKHRIISKKNSKLMQTPYNPTISQYGFALLHTNQLIKDMDIIGHTGSAYGLSSTMFFEPKQKFGFVVITNGSASTSNSVCLDVLTDCINLLYKRLIVN